MDSAASTPLVGKEWPHVGAALLQFFRLLMLAARLHVSRWSAYRANVLVWMLTIWITILIQILFGALAFHIGNGRIFGHDSNELIIFVGLTLTASGLAQSLAHGVVLNLGRAVWLGKFDHWLTQPPPLFIRLFLEDLGLVWFIPHIIVGVTILAVRIPVAVLPLALLIIALSAAAEIGIILCICICAIRWNKWDPNAGLWEYFDRARGVPITHSGSLLLMLVSAGVLHYSLALEVFTGDLPMLFLVLFVIAVHLLAYCMLRWVVRGYTSASS